MRGLLTKHFTSSVPVRSGRAAICPSAGVSELPRIPTFIRHRYCGGGFGGGDTSVSVFAAVQQCQPEMNELTVGQRLIYR